jgi:hypothetical protein
MTANSALGFWRELLQRNIDSEVLQMKGFEISRNYDYIQDLAKSLMKINPNNIKFMLLYARFLKQIVNNDQEALINFEKAL